MSIRTKQGIYKPMNNAPNLASEDMNLSSYRILGCRLFSMKLHPIYDKINNKDNIRSPNLFE